MKISPSAPCAGGLLRIQKQDSQVHPGLTWPDVHRRWSAARRTHRHHPPRGPVMPDKEPTEKDPPKTKQQWQLVDAGKTGKPGKHSWERR